MNSILQFFYSSNEIRLIQGSKQPWFLIRDICHALGFDNTALTFAALDEDQRSVQFAYFNGAKKPYYTVNLKGLNALLDVRPNPVFLAWVKEKVLPTLDGREVEQVAPKTFLEALQNTVKAEKEARKKQRAPRQAIGKPAETFTFTEVAKSLHYGRTRLFSLLREEGYLMKDNLPYQKYLEAGYFAVRLVNIQKKSGPKPYTQTLITEKGIQLVQKLLQRETVESIAH